ncbi:MAG: RNB domain-containing ribonuclease, partial [Phycisphaerales bacterium]|nr:RNB domain-containing ribonuclease [Phycisphaerales bacterium]
PRYAKSLYIRYSRNGDVRGTRAQSSLITSVKRLTYVEAQALIEGDRELAKEHARTEPVYTDELVETLREFDTLARTIEARRRRHGMISLDLPDVELVYGEEGHVIDAVKEDQSYTHTLIEMFMVEANEGVARLFERMQVPLIRRIHPEPTPGDSDTLKRMAMVAGYRIPANPTREEMQGLLDATRGTPAARAVHMALLRTLTKAEYSPALIGHFALASEAYAHFTSPIRRYPDLTVHRALKAFLLRTANGEHAPKNEKAWLNLGKDLRDDPLCLPEDALVELGRSCTTTEQNAEDAERDLRQFLVLQLLETKIGEVFNGVVTGVTPRGIYVQIESYLADGMITKEDLPGDVTRDAKPPKWKVDDRTGALVDANSGRSYNMGDTVKVRIAAVDLAKRQLDLVIDDPASRAGGKAKPLKFDSGFDGGLGGAQGAGFKQPGGSRRNRKSKSRDRGKENRRDKRK